MTALLGTKFMGKEELEARLDECDKKHKEYEAKKAKEMQNAIKLADIKRLGGIRQYEDFTAENYSNKAALALMRNYPKESYFLWGAAGTGKTHAAVAIARNVQNAQLVRMAQISRLFRKDISAEQEERVIAQFSQIPLILDDLGSEKMTDFLQGVLFEIIDRRWANKVGGLIITANMNIPSLSKIVGDRTASRIAGLVGANKIEFCGADHRTGSEEK